jgi:hypothetical protein
MSSRQKALVRSRQKVSERPLPPLGSEHLLQFTEVIDGLIALLDLLLDLGAVRPDDEISHLRRDDGCRGCDDVAVDPEVSFSDVQGVQ